MFSHTSSGHRAFSSSCVQMDDSVKQHYIRRLLVYSHREGLCVCVCVCVWVGVCVRMREWYHSPGVVPSLICSEGEKEGWKVGEIHPPVLVGLLVSIFDKPT